MLLQRRNGLIILWVGFLGLGGCAPEYNQERGLSLQQSGPSSRFADGSRLLGTSSSTHDTLHSAALGPLANERVLEEVRESASGANAPSYSVPSRPRAPFVVIPGLPTTTVVGHEPEVFLTSTPSPSASWNTSGSGNRDLSTDSGFYADPQIAASRSHIVVTERSSFGSYTRQGTQLQHVNGYTFFGSLVPSGSTGLELRTVFDRYRNRFWIIGTVKNSTTPGNQVLLTAVSGSEDPRGTWCKYAWPGPAPGYMGQIDYPSLAISADAVMVTYNAGGTWMMRFLPADQMSTCTPSNMLTGYWAWWGLQNADGSAAGLLQPAASF